MDPELEAYKKSKIAEANAAFNSSVNLLKRNLNSSISYILSTRISNRLKSYYISVYISNYNKSINKLFARLSAEIKAINALMSVPGKLQTTKSALTIGINYKNTQNELYGCINDAINIKKLLETKYGFKNITMMTDDTTLKPTKQNIINELTKILANAVAGDSIVVSYSGHGSYTTDLNINKEELDGYDELIVPIDFTTLASCIVDDELKKIIDTNLKAGVKVFILLDCCNSGTALDLKYNYLDSDNYNSPTVNPNAVETAGQIIMISGCTDSQTSADAAINDGTYTTSGAMTYAFLETIKNNKDSSITLKNMLQNMRTLLKNKNFTQIPQLSSGRSINIDTALLEL
jgi:hypothetical protein